jgi:hypothetical protein
MNKPCAQNEVFVDVTVSGTLVYHRAKVCSGSDEGRLSVTACSQICKRQHSRPSAALFLPSARHGRVLMCALLRLSKISQCKETYDYKEKCSACLNSRCNNKAPSRASQCRYRVTTQKTFAQNAIVCFVWLSQQTAIISLKSINQAIVVMETCCIFFEARTKILNEFTRASCFTSPISIYPYQRDEPALPGNLLIARCCFSTRPLVGDLAMLMSLLLLLMGWDCVSELQPPTGLLFIPQMIWVWGATVEWHWQEKNEGLGEKPVPVPLCPPQIPHGQTGASTMARPKINRVWRWKLDRTSSRCDQVARCEDGNEWQGSIQWGEFHNRWHIVTCPIKTLQHEVKESLRIYTDCIELARDRTRRQVTTVARPCMWQVAALRYSCLHGMRSADCHAWVTVATDMSVVNNSAPNLVIHGVSPRGGEGSGE